MRAAHGGSVQHAASRMAAGVRSAKTCIIGPGVCALDPLDLPLVIAVLEELPMGVGVVRAPGCQWLYANRRLRDIMGATALEEVRTARDERRRYNLRDRAGHLYPEDRMPVVRALREGCSVVAD